MTQKLLFSITAILLIGMSFSQNTYVPDDTFESYLISQGYDSGPLNDSVPTQNMNSITSIDLTWMTVSDLTGIEDCISLTELNCSIGSNLTSIDLSNNTALTWLDCSGNQLISLDLSQNVNLEHLACVHNSITSLDLSQNLALTDLQCADNQLTALDLSHNLNLEFIYCSNNSIGGLDLSQHPNLDEIICSNNNLSYLKVNNGNNLNITSNFNFNASQNPNLTCIQVDDSTWSSANWTYIDPQSFFSESCGYVSVSDHDPSSLNILFGDDIRIESDTDYDYFITGINGQVISSGHINSGSNIINYQHLSGGVYVLSLSSDLKRVTRKFIRY